MITTTDIAPFAGTVGGDFFLGFIAGYAIKKVIKLAAIIAGLFIAALAYLEYQRIVSVDWNRIHVVSQNGFFGLRMQSLIFQILLVIPTRYRMLVFLSHRVLLLVWC
jgi:uncharacterized membrane protein (Fun14 family)